MLLTIKMEGGFNPTRKAWHFPRIDAKSEFEDRLKDGLK